MEAGSDDETATLQWKGESFPVPTSLLEDVGCAFISFSVLLLLQFQKEVFKSVVSRDTWDHVLTLEDRERLLSFLPDTTDHEETLRCISADLIAVRCTHNSWVCAC